MEEAIRAALARPAWAVVGCSPSPERDSNRIAGLLKRSGYRMIPVNPNCDEVHGERAYRTLAEIPEPVDVVDVFRRSSAAGAHVDEAIAIGAKVVWMQLGVSHEAAARKAREAGLTVIQDHCPVIETRRHWPAGGGPRFTP